jgi:hypothetical protein
MMNTILTVSVTLLILGCSNQYQAKIAPEIQEGQTISCKVENCTQCKYDDFCSKCKYFYDVTNGGDCEFNLLLILIYIACFVVFIAIAITSLVCRRRRQEDELEEFYRKENYIKSNLGIDQARRRSKKGKKSKNQSRK